MRRCRKYDRYYKYLSTKMVGNGQAPDIRATGHQSPHGEHWRSQGGVSRPGGQARNHLGNQVRKGPPGAGGKPLAGQSRKPGAVRYGSVGSPRARASRLVGEGDGRHGCRVPAREGFTPDWASANGHFASVPRARGLHGALMLRNGRVDRRDTILLADGRTDRATADRGCT